MLEGGEFRQLKEVRAGETGQNIAGRPNTIASRRHWAVAESMRVFTHTSEHKCEGTGYNVRWGSRKERHEDLEYFQSSYPAKNEKVMFWREYQACGRTTTDPVDHLRSQEWR